MSRTNSSQVDGRPALPEDGELAARLVSSAIVGRWKTEGGEERQLGVDGAETIPLDAADPEELARSFPGRWNPRRELHKALEPLVMASATCLARAGWWQPGQAELVDGGLVLGVDYHSVAVGAEFADELARSGPAGISPSGFLFSLPSSPAAILGILFGLREFQSTLTEGGRAGFRALQHAVDMLAMGRVERVLAGASTVVAPRTRPLLRALASDDPHGAAPRDVAPPDEDDTRDGDARDNDARDEVVDAEIAVMFCLERPSRTAEGQSSGVARDDAARQGIRSEPFPGVRLAVCDEAESPLARSVSDFASELPVSLRWLAAPSLVGVDAVARQLLDTGPTRIDVAYGLPGDGPAASLSLRSAEADGRSGSARTDACRGVGRSADAP